MCLGVSLLSVRVEPKPHSRVLVEVGCIAWRNEDKTSLDGLLGLLAFSLAALMVPRIADNHKSRRCHILLLRLDSGYRKGNDNCVAADTKGRHRR